MWQFRRPALQIQVVNSQGIPVVKDLVGQHHKHITETFLKTHFFKTILALKPAELPEILLQIED